MECTCGERAGKKPRLCEIPDHTLNILLISAGFHTEFVD